MAWTVKALPSVESDLDRIFDHVFHSQLTFGYGPDEAAALAAKRIRDIAAAKGRLANAPFVGTRHFVGDVEFRHVTFDRIVLWFSLDSTTETVTIEAIFHGGQDHLGHMLARLTRETGAD